MNYWKHHDDKIKELEHIYRKISKQTQNSLQEIFDTYNFTYDTLYNIATTRTKNRINAKIEEWKEENLIKGYFGMLATNIYKRTRVKNSEILELLIYGVYIEEQNKLDKYEKQIMYEDANYYYQQGQEEVNQVSAKIKSVSILDMALFLYLLEKPNYSGINWKQYNETTIQYNVNQIYKQTIINIQQQNELKIDSNEYQNIINIQIKQKININNNKISGATDLQMIGLNNLAKAEGIKRFDDNAKVKFIAVTDENSTDMCQSMNNMEFYIDKENEFDRYWGENKKELKLIRIKVKGLVPGINLPPIMHHWHFCRSYITYLPIEIMKMDKKYNIFSSKIEKSIESKYNINKARIKGIDKNLLINILDNMEKVYNDFPEIKGKIKEIQSIEHPNGGMNIEPDIKDNKYIMQINRNFFGDEKVVQRQYQRDLEAGFHPKGTTYKDMGIHELGHSVTYEIIKQKYNNKDDIINDWNKNITTKEIVQKAFTNLGVNDKLTKTILRNNISVYARRKYSETIGEAFADYYANKEKSNMLSKEIINIMKGMI